MFFESGYFLFHNIKRGNTRCPPASRSSKLEANTILCKRLRSTLTISVKVIYIGGRILSSKKTDWHAMAVKVSFFFAVLHRHRRPQYRSNYILSVIYIKSEETKFSGLDTDNCYSAKLQGSQVSIFYF